jgi:superoxide dismutase, Fe-Mn family
MSKFDTKDIIESIRSDLRLPKSKDKLNEAFVTQARKFNLTTDLLSSKTNKAHQELFERYVSALNEVSAELDTADRDSANPNHSAFRSLKIDETYNTNASFLHSLYFENIADPGSRITMDSLSYMRLARDFGTFDAWQEDFIACCLASRDGWAVTVYNGFLNRYMNVIIDLHSLNVPLNCYPVVVIDCWEHAYYRDYLDDRKTYVFAMMKELNWEKIEERFKKAERIEKVLK